METTHLLDPDHWAEQTFGQALLGDRRRTRRAVKAACGLVRDPAASLPKSAPDLEHSQSDVAIAR
jgi:hypothetical protein